MNDPSQFDKKLFTNRVIALLKKWGDRQLDGKYSASSIAHDLRTSYYPHMSTTEISRKLSDTYHKRFERFHAHYQLHLRLKREKPWPVRVYKLADVQFLIRLLQYKRMGVLQPSCEDISRISQYAATTLYAIARRIINSDRDIIRSLGGNRYELKIDENHPIWFSSRKNAMMTDLTTLAAEAAKVEIVSSAEVKASSTPLTVVCKQLTHIEKDIAVMNTKADALRKEILSRTQD